MPPLPDASVFFGYDPLPVALFLDGLLSAETYVAGRRFLDVGCGIGTKLVLMSAYGWNVAGIDRYEPYLEVAAELCPEADLRLADLRDVESFDADLVYMYRPGVSEQHAREFETHVIERLTSGTVLFLPTRDIAHPGLRPVGSHVGLRE